MVIIQTVYGDFSKKVPLDIIIHAYYAFGLPDGKGWGKMEPLDDCEDIITPLIKNCKSHDVVPVYLLEVSHILMEVSVLKYLKKIHIFDEKFQPLLKISLILLLSMDLNKLILIGNIQNNQLNNNIQKFMKHLRDLCDENDLVFTVAVSATSGTSFSRKVLDLLDWVNLMAYDGDDVDGHSPYNNYTVESFDYRKGFMGVSAKKFTIEVSFYEHPN